MHSDPVSLSPFTLDTEGGGRLGAGAAATVYRARDLQGRPVALKVLDRELAADPVISDAFVAQGRAMAEIRAPGLVKIYDAGQLDDGRAFVSMEILGGRSLAEVVARERVLSPMRAAKLGIQIAEAMSALHENGTLHGDLHPGNVQLLDGDRVRLLDAGGAHAEVSVPGGVLFGSAEYLAPELVAGAARTPAADVYAVGIILYEALVGKTPFGSHSVTDVIEQQLHVEPGFVRAPAGLTPVPAALERVVLDCLRKNPDERIQDGPALARTLAGVRQDLTPPLLSAIAPPPRGRWRKAMTLAIMGVVLIAACAWVLARWQQGAGSSAPMQAAQDPAADSASITASADSESVFVEVTSEPSGANVVVRGRQTPATTPARIELPLSTTPVQLELQFPGGESTQLEVVPDRSSRVHAQSPELHRYVNTPEGLGGLDALGKRANSRKRAKPSKRTRR